MYQLLQSPLVGTILCVVILTYAARFIARGYSIRSRVHKMPGPPHSMILGHLKAMGDVAMASPRRVHPHTHPHLLRKKYKLGSIVFVDAWPVATDAFIAIMDPAVCQQVAEHNPKKHHAMQSYLIPLLGHDDMVSSNGELWKRWRTMFNPGFSTQHLMTLVQGIVDDVLIYVDKLEEHAEKNDVFRLEELTTRLTIDVIGKVVLDLHFNMQRGDNPCIEALREQVHLLPNESTRNPFEAWHPWGIYRRYKNDKVMKDYIGKVLEERFASKSTTAVKERKRTVIDLALWNYVSNTAEVTELADDAPMPKMDEAFKQGAITQIRTFLFAGHDTTSSTMCYVFYLLKKHPQVYHRLCEEHESILGPIEDTADVIKAQPHLLNKLEYTLAVIKETLRFFPAASSARQGEADLTLHLPNGERINTEGYMLWLLHYGLGRNEEVWGHTVNSFIPERFLPENLHKIPEGAWRPFETGPRNCLGQNLALLESRIIMALVCRRFEFTVALDGLEAVVGDGSFYARDETFRQGPQNVEGEELYQTLIGAAKPREGMPVRVRRLDGAKV